MKFNAAKAVIPLSSDGKFRIRQIKVLYEVDRNTGKRIVRKR